MRRWSERDLPLKVMGWLGAPEGFFPLRRLRRDQYLPESWPRDCSSTVETQASLLEVAMALATCRSRLPRSGWVGSAERRESRCRTRERASSYKCGMKLGMLPWGMWWREAVRRTPRKTASSASQEVGGERRLKAASVSSR